MATFGIERLVPKFVKESGHYPDILQSYADKLDAEADRYNAGTSNMYENWPMTAGTPGTPGTPGIKLPPLSSYEPPTDLPKFEGYSPEFLPYTRPDSVEGQLSDAELLSMAAKQASLRYDPHLQHIRREAPRMQRHAQEAAAAMGVANQGIGMGRFAIPLAQQQMAEEGRVMGEMGAFQQTQYDQLRMQERARTDQLLQQHFQNWMQEQGLDLQRGEFDFNKWYREYQLGQSVIADDFHRWVTEHNMRMAHAQAQYAGRARPGTAGTPPQPVSPKEYLDSRYYESLLGLGPEAWSAYVTGRAGIGGGGGYDPYDTMMDYYKAFPDARYGMAPVTPQEFDEIRRGERSWYGQ